MNARGRIFHSPFDFLDPEQRDIHTLSKINALLEHARSRSAFYEYRLPKAPISALSDLSDIPILRQEDLRANLPPRRPDLLTGPLSNAYVFTSGGTTGDPKFTFYSNDDINAQAHLCAKGLYLPGIRSNARAANLMNAGNLWASFTFVNKALELCGCLILPIAAQTGPQASVGYMRAFDVNAAIGIPSFFISLADYCEENNVRDINIEILATGGERMYADTKKYIRKTLGVKKFISAGYSSNDTGLIGFNCERQQGDVHHLHEDSVHVEIVDPESGEPVGAGRSGKIIVTCLNRYLMPLIRYDIGDRGRVLDRSCDCGRQLKLLQLEGRSDDTLIIAGYNISPAVIATVISQFKELSFHFQISAEFLQAKDVLKINVETKTDKSKNKRDELARNFHVRLLEEEKAIAFLIESNSTFPPIVTIGNPGSLPRNPKTGKIKQVIDKRGE